MPKSFLIARTGGGGAGHGDLDKPMFRPVGTEEPAVKSQAEGQTHLQKGKMMMKMKMMRDDEIRRRRSWFPTPPPQCQRRRQEQLDDDDDDGFKVPAAADSDIPPGLTVPQQTESQLIKGLRRFLNVSKNHNNNNSGAADDKPEEEQVVPQTDHDYVEQGRIKAEDEAGKSVEQNDDALANLTTLAEVSLAYAGQLNEPSITEKINQVMNRRHVSPSSGRTMQINVPENATHIVICTSANERKEITIAKPPQLVRRKCPKKSNNNNCDNDEGHGGARTTYKTSSEYECGECGKKYSTSSNLARHKQTHRSLTDKKAKKCNFCGKVYVSMPAFAMHVRTHNQNCRCDFCGKAFSRPWLLQGHIRTHTGERPFECSLCHKAFADKSNLRAHVQTHSILKPFACSKCGKSFALKSYLYKHEESSCKSN